MLEKMEDLREAYNKGLFYVHKRTPYYMVSFIFKDGDKYKVGAPIAYIKKEQRLKTVQRLLGRNEVFRLRSKYRGWVEFLTKEEILNLTGVNIDLEIEEHNERIGG